jgi:hypothetical protein
MGAGIRFQVAAHAAVSCAAFAVAHDASADEAKPGTAVPFVVNRGQVDRRVAYYATTPAATTYVTHDGALVHALGSAWSITERPRTRRHVSVAAAVAAPTRVAILHGADATQWQRGLASYRTVSLGEPWPQVRLRVELRPEGVEKLFTIAPGGDARDIRMSVAGVARLRIDNGVLVAGDVRFSRPRAFQLIAGESRDVDVSYVVRGTTYGFRLGSYDPAYAVVIDPLLQTSYLGGSGGEDAMAIAANATSVYVVGYTPSPNFPGTTGGAQPNNANNNDAYVARLSRDLRTFQQVTYFGGNGRDSARAVALDANGNVFIGGTTASTDLPGASTGVQTTFGGFGSGSVPERGDAYIARLTPDLQFLVRSTYLGGTRDENVRTMLVTGSTVYIAGITDSADLPGTANGAEPTSNGFSKAFVASYATDLMTRNQVTYYGASAGPYANGIAVSAAGVYIVGTTTGTPPGTTNGAESSCPGSSGFVALLAADLRSLVQASCLGNGMTINRGNAIVVASTGEIYVGGDGQGFPGQTGFTISGAQETNPSFNTGAAYVMKMNANLRSYIQGTYTGGGGRFSSVNSLALDALGNVYAAGVTAPVNMINGFPALAGGIQTTTNTTGPTKGFIMRLAGDLRTFTQATLFAGSSTDSITSIAVDGAELYAAGTTASNDLLGRNGGAQATCGGVNCFDGFVTHMTTDLTSQPLLVTLTMTGPSVVASNTNISYDVSVQNSDSLLPLRNVIVTLDYQGLNRVANTYTSSQGTCSVISGTPYQFICNLGSIAPGATATMTTNQSVPSSGTTQATTTATLTMEQMAAAGSVTTTSVTTQVPAAPTIGTLTDVVVNAGTPVPPIAVGVTGYMVTMARFSSNQSLLPNSNIALSSGCNGPSGPCTLTLTPTPDLTGVADVTLSVTDALNRSAMEVFRLTVNPAATTPDAGNGGNTDGGGGGTDPPKEGGGCCSSGGSPAGTTGLTLFVLAWCAYRRRRMRE